jgi:uncharacterized protein involved in outer membrane biogenesis
MRWKIILLISALFIISLIVTVYVILATYDFNKFKPRIIQAVREATGRELTLGGDLKVELGLSPGLSIEEVGFQNADWGSRADMARVKRIEVQAAILPLIRGDIQVKRFILVEPDILLETNKSGNTNIEFQTPEKQKTQNGKAPILIFNKVQIKNGRLTYKDRTSNSSYTLKIDRFNAVAPGKKDPLTFEVRGVFNKKSFEIQGTLGRMFRSIKTGEPLAVRLTAKTKGTTVKIEGLIRDPVNAGGLDCSLTAEGSSILNIFDFTGVSGVPDIGPYQLAARITGSADQLTIDAVDLYAGTENQLRAMLSGSIKELFDLRGIELNVSFRGKDVANLKTLFDQSLPLKGAFSVSGRLSDTTAQVYRFSDVIADLGDNKITGSVVFDLSGHRPQLTAALASQKLDLRPLSLPANFGINGAKSLANLGPFRLFINAGGPFKQLSVEKLDFQAGNENLAKISLQGSVKDLVSHRGIGLNFLIQGKNIANLEKLVNRPIPIQGAFKASGKIADLAEKNYSFNTLDVRISDSDIGGSVDLNLAGQRPQINASLVSAKINLKSIITNANPSAAAAVKPARVAMNSEKTSPGQPFPLDTLKAVDARIKFRAGQLLVPELRLNRIAVDLLLRNGDLMVTAEGPTLPDISELAGVNGLSRLGPYKFSVRAGGRGSRLAVEKLNFTTGKQEIAEIKITAAVDDLLALSGIEGRFTARGIDIANLAPLVGQPLPFSGSFTAAGNLSVPEINFYRLSNIEIVGGQGDISGRVDLNLTGKRPRLSASLSSQKLDLRPLLENADDQDLEAKKYELARDRKNKVSATHPQLLELLTMADVEFKVQVAKLLVPKLLINHFNLNFNLRDGRYNITAESRATPDISELTGVKGLSDLGPSKLILKGVATADKLTVERLDYHAGTQEIFEIKLIGSAEDLLTWREITSSFMISGNDAANLERFTKQSVPYKGPFIFSGRLTDPAHQIYSFDQIRIVIGDSNLDGWSDINLTGDRPRVKAELTSRKLDLGWLYTEIDPKDTPNRPSTKAGKERKKVFPNNPLPVDILKLADLDLKIRAEEILFPRLTMRNLTAGIKLDGEHLTVKPFKFSAGDGSVQGYIALHAEGAALALETEIEIDQIFLASKSKKFDVSRTLEGTIDAKIKISGRGDSAAALMGGLNGTITFAHRGGQIADRYFNLIFGDLTTELVQRINVFSRKQDYTEINCLVGHFAINDGLAEHAFVLDTPQSTLSAAGHVNLKTETLNMGFKTSPKKGVKVPGLGKVSLSLGELTKPVKIGGTLADPFLTVDPTRTAVTLGKVIGGLAFGPAGLAIVFGDFSTKKADPCLEAIKAAAEPVGNVESKDRKKVKKKRWWQK